MSDSGTDHDDYPDELDTVRGVQTPRVSKKVEYPHGRDGCRYEQIRESG